MSAPAPPPGAPKDARLLVAGLLSLILVVGQLWFSFLQSYGQLALALVTSLALEVVLSRARGREKPSLISAYMTGVSIGILVRSPLYWPYFAGSALAIGQKHLLRFRGRHLFNPSNFGLCVLLLAAPELVTALGKQWTNRPEIVALIFAFGAIVVGRIGRLHIAGAYALAFTLLGAFRAAVLGVPLASELAPALGPAFQLFIFFMMTDPRTTPAGRRGQLLFACAVAAAECAFRFGRDVHAPFFALLLVSPVALLLELRQKPAQKPR